jgi:hypothetical protein
MTEDDLIHRIMAHVGAAKFPPVSRQSIEDAECEIGFSLPPFLRELYLRVGNGGFGPRGGLLGLNGDGMLAEGWFTLISGYHVMRDRETCNPTPFEWPERKLPLTNCNNRLWSVLDCTQSPAPVLCLDTKEYDFNEAPFEGFLKLEAPSLEAWFEAWLHGKIRNDSW